eukprot:TRINITY_DN1612_c0_g1_i1.p1 TRINITY_DN1612_c0_g1~~TRINITY_DN1612_c0_g1_i1.p1  ORF type:complete len:197 (+),score=28.73 TRINITY_DN1612_c0_g1_i1:407-997(+)
MFATQTTHPKVVPLDACMSEAEDLVNYADSRDLARRELCAALKDSASCTKQAEWGAADLSADASRARCAWKVDPRTKASHACTPSAGSSGGRTPLEVIYTTPLTNWNPHDIAYAPDGGSDGAGSQESPHTVSSRKQFFRTPLEFFANEPEPEACRVEAPVCPTPRGQRRERGVWKTVALLPSLGGPQTQKPQKCTA